MLRRTRWPLAARWRSRRPRAAGARVQGTGERALAAHGEPGRLLRLGGLRARRHRPRPRDRRDHRRAGHARRGTTWVLSGRTGRLITAPRAARRRRTATRSPTPATPTATAYTTSSAARRAPATRPAARTCTPAVTGRCCTRSRARRRRDPLGSAVSSAGDVNHDGCDDVLVGAPGHGGRRRRLRLLGPHVQAAAPLPGAATRRTASARHGHDGDVDRDRVPDLIVGGGGAGVRLLRRPASCSPLRRSAAPRQFGKFFVAGVGDVDRDRVPDLYAADYAAGDTAQRLRRRLLGPRRLGASTRGPARARRRHRPGPRGGRRQRRRPPRPRRRLLPGERRRAGAGQSSSSPARPARRCARSRRRPRARTSASTPSASATSTATTGPTCCLGRRGRQRLHGGRQPATLRPAAQARRASLRSSRRSRSPGLTNTPRKTIVPSGVLMGTSSMWAMSQWWMSDLKIGSSLRMVGK